MAAIELLSVSKRFGNLQALEDVSLDVARGEALMLSGPSGSGKTTLLRLVAGLEIPDKGKVLIDDKVASGDGLFLPPAKRNVGMVFQDFALWPHMSAKGHIEFVISPAGLNKAERNERALAMLALVRLEDRANAYPRELSGGEQQRLAIARALAPEPKILLLDEPFSNLDHKVRSTIVGAIRRMKSEKNISVIIATHNRLDAEDLADRIFDMIAKTSTDVRTGRNEI